MRKSKGGSDELAVRAVLAAAAREAEELLAEEPELEAGSVDEAIRRLHLFKRLTERAG